MKGQPRIYVSPQVKRGEKAYKCRYFRYLKESLEPYYDVLDPKDKPCLTQSTALLAHSFCADVYLLSFLENIGWHRMAWAQHIVVLLALWIIRARRKKIVFIYHNIVPHKGENRITRSITARLFKDADLVIAHSAAAAEVARTRTAPEKVIMAQHPVVRRRAKWEYSSTEYDIFIWGDILPYKGVAEFLESGVASDKRVLILGQCSDLSIIRRIEAHTGYGVVFENRRPSFDEVAWHSGRCKYVLFPYLPGSVSGSGLLMDTIAMGGTPVGPDTGAFKDLSELGICIVYDSYEELRKILHEDHRIDTKAVEAFVQDNSWPAFAATIEGHLA